MASILAINGITGILPSSTWKQLITSPVTWLDRITGGDPSMFLVPRVLRHAQNIKAQGTLIVPQWFSSPSWPLLFPNGTEPSGFAKAATELITKE